MAAGMRGALGLASWICVGGALVMMFFVVLSGVVNTTPLNKIYFLQADTSGITGARQISQWTYFYVCGTDNQNCGSPFPRLPVGYAWYGNTNGAPAELVGDHGNGTTSTYYFYMWAFGWVFYLMALAFGSFTVISGLLSCTRIGSGFSSLLAAAAGFFQLLAAILMTITFVKTRDVFRSSGHDASIGTYAFGFSWAAAVLFGIATILFFGGCFVGRNKNNDHVRDKQTSFFRRNRSTRSRGSFIDNESQRRVVKDEY